MAFVLRIPVGKISQLLVASLLLLGSAAHVYADSFDQGSAMKPNPGNFDDDDDGKAWQEIKTEIPPAPQAANLVSFYVSPTATMNFLIDVNSISVGKDGVVRYTLVSRSQSGAENISYEGIRCETYESKLYAFGQKDGSWSRARLNDWKRINDSAGNRHHASLAKDYLCQDAMVAGKVDQIRSRIRTNRPIKLGS
jgi:CNP1-like family